MSAKILDGRAAAAAWKAGLREQMQQSGAKPCLAVVSAGDDPASEVYIRQKEKACAEMGIAFRRCKIGAEYQLMQTIRTTEQLNCDDAVTGIILQLPLPGPLGYYQKSLLSQIDPDKDVDGQTPYQAGVLALGGTGRCLRPCTACGIIKLLAHYGLDKLAGQHAVIVGRSNLVGKPLIRMLLEQDATVTVCHSRTADLAAHTRQADLLVAAAGKPGLITADMVKPGAVVVDVGMNRVNGKLCGDVDFDGVKEVAGWITPVPGGVGPMTVAALMHNTIRAAMWRQR